MKILNLYFKNINSLEGENRINFEQPPFSETGVFAITGPNGSGKSSILDAITLAMYGETFRFDKPAQHVITQHTDESFSQIEFSLGDEKYRSIWRVNRADKEGGGEISPTEMQLFRLNGTEQALANKPQEVCAKITDLTGMSFRSFTRSILLAQGDFSAFLNALDSERLDILEKMVSSDIYADHKKELTDKLALAEQKLLFLQQDLASVPLIEPKSLEACELDLADFSEQAADLQEKLTTLKQQQAQIKQVSTLKQQQQALAAALKETNDKQVIVDKQLTALSSVESARHFEADIAQSQQKKQVLEKENSVLNALRNELKQIEATLALPGMTKIVQDQMNATDHPDAFTEQKQTIDNIKAQVALFTANWQSELALQKSLSIQLADKQANLVEVSIWLDAHSKDSLLLDSFPDLERLKTLRLALDTFDDKKLALSKWSKFTRTALEKNQNKVAKRSQKLAKLNAKLTKEEQALEKIAQGNSLAQIEELQAEQKERVNHFQELLNLAKLNERLAPKTTYFFGLFSKKVPSNREAEEMAFELTELKEQIRHDENIRLSLEQAIYNDALLSRMAQERPHLIDGKPCPLCGSSEHPYSKRPPVPVNTQQALLDQKVKIRRLNAEIAQLEQQIQLVQKQAERNRINAGKLQELNARWLTLCNRLNIVSAEMELKNASTVKALLNAETKDLSNIGVLLRKYKSGQKRMARLKAYIGKQQNQLDKLQNNVQIIAAEWQTEPERIAETETEFSRLLEEQQHLIPKLEAFLVKMDESLPEKGKEDVLIDNLKNRRADYESYHTRKINLTQELDVLTAKQLSGQKQVDVYKERLDFFNAQMHTEEVIGLHLALVEKQKLIADKQQIINQIQAEIDQIDNAIAVKMADTPFTNLEAIKQSLQDLKDKPMLIQQKANLKEVLEKQINERESLNEQLANLEVPVDSLLIAEDIELKIKSCKEKRDLAVLEAERLERVIREQKQYKDRHATILFQMEEQQGQVEQVREEAAELTAENGMAFRRKVQARIIDRLLSQTNGILEKINGRYYLRQSKSEHGLALEIEDTYHNNARRLPKTLSGGESFIVSLALALGLSELASSGRSVDTLFLDEGFGNLDAETLYTVINTLEGLRAHGKTVGVISHIDAVQKRFKVQLQLVKKSNGFGMLKKVS